MAKSREPDVREFRRASFGKPLKSRFKVQLKVTG